MQKNIGCQQKNNYFQTMWNKFSENTPESRGPFYVYNEEIDVVFILDYNPASDEFGIDAFYEWQAYDGVITMWQDIKYPTPPNIIKKTIVSWEKDRDDETGDRYKYYTTTKITDV